MRHVLLKAVREKQAQSPLLPTQLEHSKLRVATKPVLVTDNVHGKTAIPSYVTHAETAMERNRKQRMQNRTFVITLKRK